jgi:hypothetical protein
MTPTNAQHDKMVAECIANGWIDKDTRKLTDAGNEYARALISAYPDMPKKKPRHD